MTHSFPTRRSSELVAADIGDDRLVHLVAADAYGTRIDDAAEREDGYLGGAAADIHNHRSGRLGHRQAGTDRRGHRLLDQEDPAGAGRFGRIHDGAALDRSEEHTSELPSLMRI